MGVLSADVEELSDAGEDEEKIYCINHTMMYL
jgi:hypothetical protein